MWMCFISLDHQCPGNKRTCNQQFEDVPEFTWRIVAAGDLQEEGKIEKNAGSPQGWEEGKNEGITSPIGREFHILVTVLSLWFVISLNVLIRTSFRYFSGFICALWKLVLCFTWEHYDTYLIKAPQKHKNTEICKKTIINRKFSHNTVKQLCLDLICI